MWQGEEGSRMLTGPLEVLKMTIRRPMFRGVPRTMREFLLVDPSGNHYSWSTNAGTKIGRTLMRVNQTVCLEATVKSHYMAYGGNADDNDDVKVTSLKRPKAVQPPDTAGEMMVGRLPSA